MACGAGAHVHAAGVGGTGVVYRGLQPHLSQLRGVTRPVSLAITSFKCAPHPVNKKEQCGADGTARIKRSEFGMTPNEAIVAATRDAAAVAHVNTGLVAAGRSADFIVLDANPLDNIANTRRIDKVFLRGQQVPRTLLAAKWQAQFRPRLAQRQD
jgi:Amidohydrolase family